MWLSTMWKPSVEPSDIVTVTGSPGSSCRSSKKIPGTPCQSTWPASTAEPACPGAGPKRYHATTEASAGMASSPVAGSTPAATTGPVIGDDAPASTATGTGPGSPASMSRWASWVAMAGGGATVVVGAGAVVVVGGTVVVTATVVRTGADTGTVA